MTPYRFADSDILKAAHQLSSTRSHSECLSPYAGPQEGLSPRCPLMGFSCVELASGRGQVSAGRLEAKGSPVTRSSGDLLDTLSGPHDDVHTLVGAVPTSDSRRFSELNC